MTALGEAGTSRRPRPELLLRVGSSLVLAPAAIAATWAGGLPFLLLCAVTAAILLREWDLVARAGFRDRGFLASIGALAFAVPFAAAGRVLEALAVVLLGGLAVAALSRGKRPLWAGAGLLFAAVIPLSGLTLRGDQELGFTAVLWLFLIVWASDTAAYGVGRLVGGPKLSPRFSPKKTWSGSAGGLLAATLVGAAAAQALAGTPLLVATLLSAAFGVIAQAGDLAESAFKRHFHVKDAGHLIPGHGGLMDRADGLVAVLAAAALLGSARAPSAAQGLLLW